MTRTKSNHRAWPRPFPPPIQGPSSPAPASVHDEPANMEPDQTWGGSPRLYLNMEQFELETAAEAAQGTGEGDA